ncbi:MAG: hypothetical protein G01um10148_987 [Parcubacteria group bacterium Gr01-1014_8]|nr:MAG: hypothetical protein G01um10148_987 [Parcubacteria group bacterium Gr01-1014_8]
MIAASKTFFIFGILALGGASYLFLQVITDPPRVVEVIVFPIYIGFAVILAGACFLVALILYLMRQKR